MRLILNYESELQLGRNWGDVTTLLDFDNTLQLHLHGLVLHTAIFSNTAHSCPFGFTTLEVTGSLSKLADGTTKMIAIETLHSFMKEKLKCFEISY
ncbi:hypothetical protein CEXT_161191 [Caerostris extrusa]|uniref:Uncharacterized protein n=1 Tax=Caerostris extrusa TaxID=172846 RepID=A0AAV4TZQ4_CAEEX|nr:hypothetical protein CEXT_161191 [Caerostris extrusa]